MFKMLILMSKILGGLAKGMNTLGALFLKGLQSDYGFSVVTVSNHLKGSMDVSCAPSQCLV